jgi:hypothetical protein
MSSESNVGITYVDTFRLSTESIAQGPARRGVPFHVRLFQNGLNLTLISMDSGTSSNPRMGLIQSRIQKEKKLALGRMSKHFSASIISSSSGRVEISSIRKTSSYVHKNHWDLINVFDF